MNLKNPKTRVKAAWALFYLSLIAMIINVVLFLAHIINEADLILVTLILSWLAITLTAIDILVTTDVRKEQDKD